MTVTLRMVAHNHLPVHTQPITDYLHLVSIINTPYIQTLDCKVLWRCELTCQTQPFFTYVYDCLTEYIFKEILSEVLLGSGTCFSFFHLIMLIIKLFARLPVNNSYRGWGVIITMGVLLHILLSPTDMELFLFNSFFYPILRLF